MYRYQDIRKIHVEVTQNCQANCPMCDRNQNGGSLNPHIDLSEISLSDAKHIFKPDFIRQLDTMYMCGNLGDPIIAKDTLEIFEYFRTHNSHMWLSMNTNAGARDSDWWSQLAKIYGKKGAVIFSVDGLEDTNHLYRQGVNWSAVENSMRSFVAAGGRARWDFLVFEHNQHQVQKAEEFSIKLGVERFVTKKTGRFVTANTDPKHMHQAVNKKNQVAIELKKPVEKYQNAALRTQDDVVKKHGSMDSYYDDTPIKCKVKDEGNLFITAEGLALPCCWTAGRMYKWWHSDPGTEQIWEFINDAGGKDNINAKLHGLKKIFETGIFDNIEHSWSKPSVADGKLKVCSMKCGTEFDPFAAQFR